MKSEIYQTSNTFSFMPENYINQELDISLKSVSVEEAESYMLKAVEDTGMEESPWIRLTKILTDLNKFTVLLLVDQTVNTETVKSLINEDRSCKVKHYLLSSQTNIIFKR